MPIKPWLAALAALLAGGLGVLAWQPQLALEADYARQRWLADAREQALDAGGHRWVYLEAGAGPPLLLIHGFTGAKENWLPVMAALARHYRVIAPDLPGWGDSERRDDTTYGFAEQASHLEAFVAAVAPGAEAIDLVGHSMGGGIAALWAGGQPERLRRLVLLDAAGVPFDNAFARRVVAGEHPFQVSDRASLDHQLALVFKRPPWVPWPADRAYIAQRRAQIDFERRVLRTLTADQATAFAPGEAARAIAVPTLLLWCRDDQVIDASAAQVYADRIADRRIEWLDDCNHMPMMEVPAATAEALLEFLQRP